MSLLTGICRVFPKWENWMQILGTWNETDFIVSKNYLYLSIMMIDDVDEFC